MITTSNIQLANERVPITDACKLIGMHDVDYGSSGAKIRCPFGDLWHADGGASPAFRIYEESNSSYCFACSQGWGPVALLSQQRDISLEQAADLLLEAVGYKEQTPEARWEALLNQELPVDQEALASALKLHCSRIDPDWEVKQFDERVAKKFRQCVELLPNVRSAEQTNQWVTAAKAAMTKVLGESS